MNKEYRISILANYSNMEVKIKKDVLDYDSSSEIWPGKDVMRAQLKIFNNKDLVYDKLSCTSTLFFNNVEQKMKELDFSLRSLAISWLKPHIDDGYNPDFIINSILEYTKNKDWVLSYITETKIA